MKKLLSLFLIICTYSVAFAQKDKFEIGIQTGLVNIEKLRHSDDSHYTNDYSAKLTALMPIGLFLQYKLAEHFSLRVDPSFEAKGYFATYEYLYTYPDGSTTIFDLGLTGNFNYITLPILMRAHIGNKVKYFINAGPYTGFLLSQSTTFNLFNGELQKENTISNYKTLDFGITWGLGLSIPIKQVFALSFEFRKNSGLMDISKSSNSTDKTSSFNFLLVGFSYRLGGKITKDEQEIIYLK